MAKLGFFNHQWNEVYSYFHAFRYSIDQASNVFIFEIKDHPHAEREVMITVHSIDEAREFFVEKIHKGWKQRKILGGVQSLID